jgi:hypothetical protein
MNNIKTYTIISGVFQKSIVCFIMTFSFSSLILCSGGSDNKTNPVPLQHKPGYYMIYYGQLTSDVISKAKTYSLVILHPWSETFTRANIFQIQQGIDPADPSDDVKVLLYISVGEDQRTAELFPESASIPDYAAMLLDSRFTGDGTGPKIDPRGPKPNGDIITANLHSSGISSTGGTGYASYYLDDNSLNNDGVADGKPDFNLEWKCAYVNPGDPNWYIILRDMTIDSVDKQFGIKEILTTTYGRGLGCDGLFLDTLDTCAPNSFTDGSDFVQAEFEWTATGVSALMQQIKIDNPGKLLLQNRALFFLNPDNNQHYKFTTRGQIDYLLFESYRLDSSSLHEYDPDFFPDNKFNIMPKLMAEANRPDGFTVLSLGYAEGPGSQTDWYNTLRGSSEVYKSTLLTDIYETQTIAGFRHYLTNRLIDIVNDFVFNNSDINTDTTPPEWLSTYNDHYLPFPSTSPTQRKGIQEIEDGSVAGSVIVRWDVALDMHRVGYALYCQNISISGPVIRTVLVPSVPANYKNGTNVGVYPYEATIYSLISGDNYTFNIRAFDTNNNEDSNILTITHTIP